MCVYEVMASTVFKCTSMYSPFCVCVTQANWVSGSGFSLSSLPLSHSHISRTVTLHCGERGKGRPREGEQLHELLYIQTQTYTL